jgi:hypothetical protein
MVILVALFIMHDGERLAEALPSGLSGVYWDVNTEDITTLAQADAVIAGGGPTGMFTTTTIDYMSGDLDTIQTFLGATDGATFSPILPASGGDMSDAVIQITGTYASAGSVHFTLTSDDGARLTIDGVDVIDLDGLHAALTSSADVSVSAGSIFELTYFNHIYNGGSGDARLALTNDFIPIPIPTPEPSASLLLGIGLISLIGQGWRRRRQKAALRDS